MRDFVPIGRMLMSFMSKDLMVSILPSQNATVTCPEHTIPGSCTDTISAVWAESAEEGGLALLQQQLRLTLDRRSD
jgi:hypothetical protein